jgi:STE24 endopeptidase
MHPLLALAATLALAQAPTPPTETATTQTATTQAAPTPTAIDPTGPVTIPEPTEKAREYHDSGNRIWLFQQLWSLAIPALLLFTGISARLRTKAQKLGKGWYRTFALYILFFTALTFAIDLLPNFYSGYYREHAYGLSNQTLSKWTGDQFIGAAVTLVISLLFFWVPFALIKKSPNRWWLYTGLLVIPFFALILFIAPMWIEPLFNDFGPMKNKNLETQILALADRAGIEGSRVYEVNKSVDTNKLNAYVTGFLSTKRIVLWDTIIARLTPRELLTVMGHEMGHYVLGHIWRMMFFFSAVVILLLFAAHHTSKALIRRFQRTFGFTELHDFAALPLILMMSIVFGLIFAPITNSFIRYQEREADRYALDLTGDKRAFAEAFVKLQEDNLAIPRPGLLYKLWRQSHPSIGERIDFCNNYQPERRAP